MPDKPQQKHRTNRVFKSLHKPLTYLGVERTLFYFVYVSVRGRLQPLQFHPRRYRRIHWRLCLRPLGNEQRSGIPPHPRQVRTLQTALRRGQTASPFRGHLRVGDHIVPVLTMKEAITETKPLVLDTLKIPANFYVVTEWTPLRRTRRAEK
jgi:hypothetical protein